PAGLFMVMARTILRAVGARSGGLDAVLAEANAVLHGQIEDDKFMTMLLLEPARDGRSIRTCLAGHEPPAVWRRDGGSVELLQPQGLALGMFASVRERLSEVVIPTGPGDVVLCYTDGVTEARS